MLALVAAALVVVVLASSEVSPILLVLTAEPLVVLRAFVVFVALVLPSAAASSSSAAALRSVPAGNVAPLARLARALPVALVFGAVLVSALASAAFTGFAFPLESASITMEGLAAALGLACAVLLAAGLITAFGQRVRGKDISGLTAAHDKRTSGVLWNRGKTVTQLNQQGLTGVWDRCRAVRGVLRPVG